ncbi:Rid family hydrolase [Streptomyces goshikiensis]|uniref:Rid family hydrolase n=1 Tax=Streptomyces goshikiensis TaxID=1942 RepID=UPI0036FAB315
MRRCLAAAGAGFDDVVKLTYFVTDVAHLAALREARAAGRLPAQAFAVVPARPGPDQA